MNQLKKTVAILILFITTLSIVSISGCTGQRSLASVDDGNVQTSIMVYCGAGMSEPMDEIGSLYKQKYGVTVEYNYAGSNTLLSQIELTKKGDVYMPGSTEDFEIAKNKSLVLEGVPVVYHVPVIAVPDGNPANITCIEDMGKPGMKLVLGDNPACAIGKLGDKILEKNKVKADVDRNVIARASTVNELVTYIVMDQADASLIWEDLYVPGKMEIIAVPKKQNIIKVVPIGVLACSDKKDTAEQFVEFVSSEEGKAVFARHGFTTYPDARYE